MTAANSKMRTAIAAYTPNVPWARFGEPTVVDLIRGEVAATGRAVDWFRVEVLDGAATTRAPNSAAK